MSAENWTAEEGDAGLAELVRDIVAFIRTHVVMTEEQALAIALWVLHCHVHDVVTHSPILLIRSPAKRSGKTTLLDVIAELVPEPTKVSLASSAALYRFGATAKPTLLLDEAEHYATHKNAEMIAVLNSGHRRGSGVLRVAETRKSEARTFRSEVTSAWYPKAIASNRPLPDTVEDRAIIVLLLRKRHDEAVELLTPEQRRVAGQLKKRVAPWATENADKVAAGELTEEAAAFHGAAAHASAASFSQRATWQILVMGIPAVNSTSST